MFNKTRPELESIDIAINRVLNEMAEVAPYSVQYAKMSDQLSKLHDIRARVLATRSVSNDTIASILANLVGIGMILHHERAHVITTKALGFVPKLR